MWAPLRKLFATSGVPSWFEPVSPSARSKEGQRGRNCLFIIGVGAGKFSGCEGFCSDFPKLAEKFFCATFASKFSPTKIMKTSFWCNLQKKVFLCFYAKPWAPFLEVKQRWGIFLPGFQGFCPDFQLIKTFGVELATPAPHLQHHCFPLQYHRLILGLSRSTWNKFIAATPTLRKFRMIF